MDTFTEIVQLRWANRPAASKRSVTLLRISNICDILAAGQGPPWADCQAPKWVRINVIRMMKVSLAEML
jgi:hypothetical protein